MIDNIKKYIHEHSMIKNGDSVLAALSGGADSVCLLHILVTLREEWGLTVYAAHVNHGLREQAGEDQAFAQQLCAKWGVDISVRQVDVADMAAQRGISHELAGREARYSFFHEQAERLDCRVIAVAHNKNDQAETLLMRLIRGSGTDGLSAILPVRGMVVRPLLHTSRAEIEEYCALNGLAFQTDHTNFEPVHTRNRVRLELIPFLEGYNPAIVSALAAAAQNLAIDRKYLDQAADKAAEQALILSDGKAELKDADLHPAMTVRLTRRAVSHVTCSPAALSPEHIKGIQSLKAVGKRLDLPGGIIARRGYNSVVFSRPPDSPSEFSVSLGAFPCAPHIPQAQTSLRAWVSDERVQSTKCRAAFDLHKLALPLTARNRRNGDRMSLIGMDGHKKVKDILADLKIPFPARQKTVVLTDAGGKIIWLGGIRASREAVPDENTEKFLIIEIKFE